MLVEGTKRYILHENGTQELYWMGVDPEQLNNAIQNLTDSEKQENKQKVWALSAAQGPERRSLEVE
jgi:hypothetical protein